MPDKKPGDVVGHKTFVDESGSISHEPLTREEAAALVRAAEEWNAKLAEDMPDTETALRVLTDAYRRLEQLGWRSARYAPKKAGVAVDLIEAGCSAFHLGRWRGDKDRGCFFVSSHGDEWPSHPILFRVPGTPDAEAD